MKNKAFPFVLLLLLPFMINAQSIFRGSYWKQQRKELTFGIGASNFLGELGGQDQIGTNFAKDLEPSATRYVISAGYRYYLQRWLAVRGNLSYGVVSGDDALTNEPFRNNRNLSFKAPIIEAAGLMELHIIEEKKGSKYKLRGAKGSFSSKLGLYLFGGIGLTHFTPKGQYTDGKWYNLRPLSTEGQELEGGPEKYSNITVALPVGLGLKYYVSRKLRIGLEVGIRKTYSDYIDDVSGDYFDVNVIREEKGDVAAYFADRSLEMIGPGGTWQTRPGEQRGDSDDLDSYMFAQLTVGYKLFKQRGFRRIKSRRSVPSF